MTCSQERVKRYDAGGCVYREEANFYVGIITSSMGKVVPRKSDRSAGITPLHPPRRGARKSFNIKLVKSCRRVCYIPTNLQLFLGLPHQAWEFWQKTA